MFCCSNQILSCHKFKLLSYCFKFNMIVATFDPLFSMKHKQPFSTSFFFWVITITLNSITHIYKKTNLNKLLYSTTNYSLKMIKNIVLYRFVNKKDKTVDINNFLNLITGLTLILVVFFRRFQSHCTVGNIATLLFAQLNSLMSLCLCLSSLTISSLWLIPTTTNFHLRGNFLF